MCVLRLAQYLPSALRQRIRPIDRAAADRIQSQAADYFHRLQEDPSSDLREQIRKWRSDDVLHQIAYSRAETLWHRAGLLEKPVQPSNHAVVLTTASVRVPGCFRWLVAPGMPVIVAVCLVGMAAVTQTGQTVSSSEHAGELISLADGTTVTLAPATRLRVRLSDSARRIEVMRGEAQFSVAHESRPFEVSAGNVIATAKGTVFSVGFNDQRNPTIAVTQGLVAVNSLSHDMRADAPVLMAGETATVTAKHVFIEASPARKLRFRGTRLSAAVREFNLYNARQLRIVDPDIGSIRFGGTYAPTNVEGFLRALDAFGIESELDGPEILLYARGARGAR